MCNRAAMRTGWLGVTMVAACGDDGAVPHDAAVAVDALVDAAIDAPGCGFTVAPTRPASGATCNSVTQSGCAANEKCTWIQRGTTGDVGCAPVGHAQDDCACTVGAAGATGYDDCAAGLACVEGRCAAICDPTQTAPACDPNEGLRAA